ncbi:MAG: DUF1902 domain-containing protein [Defluviitaleaceae bacterium]|nr:DUF1902 domain-containing protein [Defluviitaleaceae bacterium]MCL2239013.1 DUF1902 domain-containing protein [Defluviitaleaceae bacterium]
MEFLVEFSWYEDERIWLATSSNDKFAMTLDHGSFDALLERVKIALYDIAENDLGYHGEVKIKLMVDRTVSMDVLATA